MSVGFIPTSAFALPEDATSMNVLLHDPLLMLAVLVGFLGVGASLILCGVLLHMRTLNCKNTSCIHHPRSLKGNSLFDFSSIGTPAELVGSLRNTKEAVAAPQLQSSEKSSSPVSTSVALAPEQTDRQNEEIGEVDLDLEDFDFSFACQELENPELENPEIEDMGLEDMEIEEPQERTSMDFTGNMIIKVRATLERQQELERQAIVRQVVEQQQELAQQALMRRQARAAQRESGSQTVQVMRQTSSQQQGAEHAVAADFAPQSEREPLLQGRHFRPAALSLGTSEGATLEDMAYHRPAEMRHSRDKSAEERLQRVS
jgi:hypothetical protein